MTAPPEHAAALADTIRCTLDLLPGCDLPTDDVVAERNEAYVALDELVGALASESERARYANTAHKAAEMRAAAAIEKIAVLAIDGRADAEAERDALVAQVKQRDEQNQWLREALKEIACGGNGAGRTVSAPDFARAALAVVPPEPAATPGEKDAR